MDGRFIIPIALMLGGLGTWTAYLIARSVSGTVKHWPTQVPVGVAVVAGGLIAASGYA